MKLLKSIDTLALLLLALLLPASAVAYDLEVDGIYYNINGSEASVTYKTEYFKSYSGDVNIPEAVTYNGTTYSVTAIGDHAFHGCSSLTSVSIPNSVTTIGLKAFYDCSGLTSVDISNSVITIGILAFQDCIGLTDVTIGNSVTTIKSGAFESCSSLTNVTFGRSVTIIGNGAFHGCSNLKNVSLPNSVTAIGNGAFGECIGLVSVNIPNSVTFIDYAAFFNCSGLTDVYSDILNLSNAVVEDKVFYDTNGDYSGRTLHVPQGTAEVYQADEHWYPYFGQIVEDMNPNLPSGDVNGDGEVNIADVNAVIDVILSGGSNAAADVNNDGVVNIADINAVIDIILSGNTPPRWPGLG